eukprot:CAMPEP_0173148350 /NCGR_PEP_ID=MMETSP1105-20130129/9659_1 /TAXON_ID=2985 /ORGANISM="Ochromonas sp., Strain BG-1" /LENGTH=128 /DNA_ID=CAMNT_0014062971 /DNA_START=874 /DNA_END=1260 /DNA_ORIENTATION=-
MKSSSTIPITTKTHSDQESLPPAMNPISHLYRKESIVDEVKERESLPIDEKESLKLQIQALEQKISEMTSNMNGMERHLQKKEKTIEEMDRKLQKKDDQIVKLKVLLKQKESSVDKEVERKSEEKKRT